VAETFAEIIKPAADCDAASFLQALKPGTVMRIPVPAADVAASRRQHLHTIGTLNQVRADIQSGNAEKADADLAAFILGYVKTFTDSIAAGRS
jgi:hypothetical protein